MSQAYIGYQMQESLLNELHTLGINKEVVTLVTQVEVASESSVSTSNETYWLILYRRTSR